MKLPLDEHIGKIGWLANYVTVHGAGTDMIIIRVIRLTNQCKM